MHPSKKFNFGLTLGIVKAIRVWAGFNPKRIAKLWKRYKIFRKANQHRIQLYKNENLVVPPTLILSATMRCNLSCKECYSRNYSKDNEMTLKEIESLLEQAEELGVMVFVITGGEPLLRKGLTELLIKHSNLIYLLFTNSSYISPAWVKSIKHFEHIIPILSIEGNEQDTDRRRGKGVYQQVINSMAYLTESMIFFGFSCMVTKQNIAFLSEDSFIDNMIILGCRIGFYVRYVPSANEADMTLVPTTEQQILFNKRIKKMKSHKRIIFINMPDDEYELGGTCMAAGRGFLHVNAQGYVEPCPFSHFASDSVRKISLKTAFKSLFFTYIRNHPELLTQPQIGCALYEHKEELNKIAVKFGAKPTG